MASLGAGKGTQGFMHAQHAIYHCATVPTFCHVYVIKSEVTQYILHKVENSYSAVL